MSTRLGLSALSSPLRHGRRKLPARTSIQRATFTTAPPCRSCSMPNRSGCGGNAGSARSESSVVGGSSRAKGSGKRGRMAVVGFPAVFLAAVTIAKEEKLPENLAEWDDNLVWDEVHGLAQLSNMTNKAPQLIAKWFECHGYTGSLVVRDLPQVSARYFVHVGHLPGEEHRRVHHIAFRGTVSLTDLSIDLKTRLVFDEECGCFFHMGFKEVADAVVQDIEEFLERDAEIQLAGHSLGGSVAVIVAAKLKHRGYTVGRVMTFGAPMLTDTRGAALLREFLPVMRVTHERDPIPLVPLTRAKISPSRDDGSPSTVSESKPGSGRADRVGNADGSTGVSVAGREQRPAQNGVGHEGEGVGNGMVVRDPARWRIGTPSAYSHFGSQVVLLRRNNCIECRREQASAPSPPSQARLQRRYTTPVGPWDDLWLPAAVSRPSEETSDATSPVSGGQQCEHCPSRGTTYYDPKGEDGCFFDSAWLRLSNVNFTHRMNHYEREVADRLQHHLLRDGRGESPSSPPSEPPSSAPVEGRMAIPPESSSNTAAVC